MANYFGDIMAPDVVAEESFLKSTWDWLKPILLTIPQSWVTYVVGTCGILATILAISWPSIVKHGGYLFNYKEKVSLMRSKINSLDILKDVVENRQRDDYKTEVEKWLVTVIEVREKVAEVPDNFNLFNLYSRGKIVEDSISKIDSLIDHQEHHWEVDPDAAIRSRSGRAFHSTESPDLYIGLESRNSTFRKVLNAFQDNNISRIGIWGFGGVGKTTMKNQLKHAAERMRLFDYIIDVNVGKGGDKGIVQEILANQLNMKEVANAREGRVKQLGDKFDSLTKDGKKILVILDDLWEPIEMKLLGLSPLAGGNDCFKLLLITRDVSVCRCMDVQDDAIYKMEPMSSNEAWLLLQQLTDVPKYSKTSLLLHRTGQQIVALCGGLPIAIKNIAKSLEFVTEVDEWTRVLHRLEDGRMGQKVFDDSYTNLSKECQQIFLLCCFFPPDGDIPVEDLVRYAVGLQLLERSNGMEIIMDIRDRVQYCIQMLKSKNFLQDGGRPDCVKMHDLVWKFGCEHVLSDATRTPLAIAVVNHGDLSRWPNTKLPYTSISLKCSHKRELPHNFPKANLKILKLLGGGDTLVFPEDFYVGMQNLEVIAYENIRNPLLPGRRQYFNNLRSLSLVNSRLSDNIEMIGDLFNLEILSLAGSSIQFLPEEIGNLSQLRLLDLTDCVELRIHENVLGRLHSLEELYIKGQKRKYQFYPSRHHLSDANISDLNKLCEKLRALDFEFHDDMDVAEYDMQLQNLMRFRISVGTFLFINDDCYRNTLRLATTKEIIKKWKIDVLLKSTDTLYLKVYDMNHISELFEKEEIQRPLEESLYGVLRNLTLIGCSRLKSAFSLSLAYNNCLEKLEYLSIEDCAMLEEIVGDGSREENGRRLMGFPRLKKLCLRELPRLAVFSKSIDVVEFPELKELELSRLPLIKRIFPESDRSSSSVQSFFNQQVTMSKLNSLTIAEMDDLWEFWPSQFNIEFIHALRSMEVRGCKHLRNLFSANWIDHLENLEKINIKNCYSLTEVFNLEGVTNTSHCSVLPSLRSVSVYRCKDLRHLFYPSIPGNLAQQINSLEISDCQNFIGIDSFNGKNGGPNSGEWVIPFEKGGVTFLPWSLIQRLRHLKKLCLIGCDSVEVVFDMESVDGVVTAKNDKKGAQHGSKAALQVLNDLERLELHGLNYMTHVWKNSVFLQQRGLVPVECFRCLTHISISQCDRIEYLFTPSIAKALVNLKGLSIGKCEMMSKLVSDGEGKEGEETYKNSNFFPKLDHVLLQLLPSLGRIGGGAYDVGGRSRNIASSSTAFWSPTSHRKLETSREELEIVVASLCNSRHFEIFGCHSLSYVIPSFAITKVEKLEELWIVDSRSVIEVFQSRGIPDTDDERNEVTIAKLSKMVLKDLQGLECIWRSRDSLVLQFPSLRELTIYGCPNLRHVFSFSTVDSLQNLEFLKIGFCDKMEVIVKDEYEGYEATTIPSSTSGFGKLRSLKLKYLESLNGISFPKHAFNFQSLETTEVYGCPNFTSFNHEIYRKLMMR